MKLYEQLKLINKRTNVIIECRYKNKAEEWIETLHDGELRDMNLEKFFDAMYYEVSKIYLKFGCIYIECHPKYKD